MQRLDQKNDSQMNDTKKIIVKGLPVAIYVDGFGEYISLTDVAKYKNESQSDDVIKNWLRNRNTIELLGLWEQIHNLEFNPVEFDGFRNQAGLNSFALTPKKWIDKTNAIGITSKSGRYGGTFAHKDIAFEFASWISIEFKLYIIKEFQRLKDEDAKRNRMSWDLQRMISKINYKIHTDAINENLIPPEITREQANLIYASEADLLNVALFGMTSNEWRKLNPKEKDNLRDQASLEQLVVLSNLESINALLITNHLSQAERIVDLNKIAIVQMKSILGSQMISNLKQLK